MVSPPLTLSTCPVMNPAAGDAKNATAITAKVTLID